MAQSPTISEVGQLCAAAGFYLYIVMTMPESASNAAEIIGIGLLIWGLDSLGRLGAYHGIQRFADRVLSHIAQRLP